MEAFPCLGLKEEIVNLIERAVLGSPFCAPEGSWSSQRLGFPSLVLGHRGCMQSMRFLSPVQGTAECTSSPQCQQCLFRQGF